MHFPITITCNTEERVLLVTQSLQAHSVVNRQTFIEELQSNLHIITQAARERFSFRNSSVVIAEYLHYSQQQDSATNQREWQIYKPEDLTAQDNLYCMVKLVNYLKKYGTALFPSLFVHQRSVGNRAIQTALHDLARLTETPSMERQALSPSLIGTPSTSSQITSSEDLENAKILMSLSTCSNPVPPLLQRSELTLLSHETDDIIDSENEENSELQPKSPLTAVGQEASALITPLITPFRIKRKHEIQSKQSPSKKKQKTSHTSFKNTFQKTLPQQSMMLSQEKDNCEKLKAALASKVQQELNNKALFSSQEDAFFNQSQVQEDLKTASVSLNPHNIALLKAKEDYLKLQNSLVQKFLKTLQEQKELQAQEDAFFNQSQVQEDLKTASVSLNPHNIALLKAKEDYSKLQNSLVQKFLKTLQEQKELQAQEETFFSQNKALSDKAEAPIPLSTSSPIISEITQNIITHPIANFSIKRYSLDCLSSTYFLSYKVRWNNTSNYNIKTSVIDSLLATKNNIIRIITSTPETSIVKWKEHKSIAPLSVPIPSRQEILSKILQGLLTNKQHFTKTHPQILLPFKGQDSQKLLDETITLLKQAFHNEKIPLPSDETLLQENVSLKEPKLPIDLLNSLERDKILEISKLQQTQPDSFFTCLFVIKKQKRSSNFYQLGYTEITSSIMPELRRKCCIHLKQTLEYIDNILAKPLENLVLSHPIHKDQTQPITSKEALLQLVIDGLTTNQIYLTQYPPYLLKKLQYQPLLKSIQNKIEELKTQTTVSQRSASAETIIAFTEQMKKPSHISLHKVISNSALIRTKRTKKKTLPILKPSYIFFISPIFTYAHYYRVGYTIISSQTQKSPYAHVRKYIHSTINYARNMLEHPSIEHKILFEDPTIKTGEPSSTIHDPQIFWPLILTGLLEMKLFYEEYCPELIHPPSKSLINTNELLVQTIQDIQNKYPSYCHNPIQQASIIPKLMGVNVEEVSDDD